LPVIQYLQFNIERTKFEKTKNVVHSFKDLSVGVISVLTDIVWKITVAWHAGNIACKVIRFSQVRTRSINSLHSPKQ
jgi:hypothetical protein